MQYFWGELVGTMILILVGNGSVANLLLKKTRGSMMSTGSQWLTVIVGYALGVMLGVFAAAPLSGGHLNPAVTIVMAVLGKTPWNLVPVYIAGQFAGAFIASVLVWLVWLPQWAETDDQGAKLGIFCTSSIIGNHGQALFVEIVATFVLVMSVLAYGAANIPAAFGPFFTALLIVAIGCSVGGPTGFAMNPARDLAPRFAHFILPIAGKGDSDWGYAWVPLFGPIIGALLAGGIFTAYMSLPH